MESWIKRLHHIQPHPQTWSINFQSHDGSMSNLDTQVYYKHIMKNPKRSSLVQLKFSRLECGKFPPVESPWNIDFTKKCQAYLKNPRPSRNAHQQPPRSSYLDTFHVWNLIINKARSWWRSSIFTGGASRFKLGKTKKTVGFAHPRCLNMFGLRIPTNLSFTCYGTCMLGFRSVLDVLGSSCEPRVWFLSVFEEERIFLWWFQ